MYHALYNCLQPFLTIFKHHNSGPLLMVTMVAAVHWLHVGLCALVMLCWLDAGPSAPDAGKLWLMPVRLCCLACWRGPGNGAGTGKASFASYTKVHPNEYCSAIAAIASVSKPQLRVRDFCLSILELYGLRRATICLSQARPASLKYWQEVESDKFQILPPHCRHALSFVPFLEFCFLMPVFSCRSASSGSTCSSMHLTL